MLSETNNYYNYLSFDNKLYIVLRYKYDKCLKMYYVTDNFVNYTTDNVETRATFLR